MARSDRCPSLQTLEHRGRADRMARHRQDRRLDQEAAVPQERGHPRELQARKGGQWAVALPWFGERFNLSQDCGGTYGSAGLQHVRCLGV